MCNVAYSLLVIEKQACDEIAFHKMCNATHLLLVIAEDVMSTFHKFVMSLTCCLS